MSRPNKMETSEVYRNVYNLLNPKKKKKVKTVKPGMRFTPTDGEYEGFEYEVDYRTCSTGSLWGCSSWDSNAPDFHFDEEDILRWINS